MKNIRYTNTKYLIPTLTKLLTIILLISSLTSCFWKGDKELEKGVFIGENNFSKEIFYSDTALGAITWIQELPKDSNSNNEFVVIGRLGAVYLDKNGKPTSQILFEEKMGRVELIENGTASGHEFMNRGGGWRPISVIDKTGKTKWKYSKELGSPNDMAVADIDGDGDLEMLVTTNVRGVFALDEDMNVIWKNDDKKVWNIATFWENGKELIIHSNGTKGPIIRTLNGEFVRQIESDIESFEIDVLSKSDDQQVIWANVDDEIVAYDFFGKKLMSKPFESIPNSSAFCQSSITGNGGHVVAVQHRAKRRTTEVYFVDNQDMVKYYEVYEAKIPVFVDYWNTEKKEPWVLIGNERGEVFRYRSSS